MASQHHWLVLLKLHLGSAPRCKGYLHCCLTEQHVIEEGPRFVKMYGGYGGFGYSTLHVRPDDPTQLIVKAASLGDMDEIERLLQEASNLDNNHYDTASPLKCSFSGCKKSDAVLQSVCKKCRDAVYCGDYHKVKHRNEHKKVCCIILPNDANRRRVLNASKRWTEVDFNASGFTKEYEWHGLTPLATAASSGKHEVVEFLLKEGADPMLRGCATEDEHYDALGAAKSSLKCKEQTLAKYFGKVKQPAPYSYLSFAKEDTRDPNEIAASLLNGKANANKRCVDLLEAASPFWKSHSNSFSHYNKERHLHGYQENPSDLDALQKAVSEVPLAVLAEKEAIDNLAAHIQEHNEKVKEYKREAERKRKIEERGDRKRGKQRRQFYS